MTYVLMALNIIVLILCLLIFFKKNSETDDIKGDLLGAIAHTQTLMDTKATTMQSLISDIKSDTNEKISSKLSDIERSNYEMQEKLTETLNKRLGYDLSNLMERGFSKISVRSETLNEGVINRLIEIDKNNASHQEKTTEILNAKLDNIRDLTEERLIAIQSNMNEKLDTSLSERLDQSFGRVTSQLSELYKSLGELNQMSDGITSLNKALSNVKTRGTFGEMQLDSILSETLQQGQYVKNIKFQTSSDDVVEFAVKIPSKTDENEIIYLPIDSKFPMDMYLHVTDAYESGNKGLIEKTKKDLADRIKLEARKIKDKYIVPGITTDFAVMFLPTESLYAEVLSIPGLAELCQTEYRIIISGPSTVTALLSSLRIGFANLAINKKTAEIRKILQAVKTQYSKLDELIITTKKKLDGAVAATDKLQDRTRIIQKSMAKIEMLEDQGEADKLLDINDDSIN